MKNSNRMCEAQKKPFTDVKGLKLSPKLNVKQSN